jgi:hypothetical protein
VHLFLDFFREYKDTVKEVMLYYRRMLKLRGATQEAHLGCLPMVLRRSKLLFLPFQHTVQAFPLILNLYVLLQALLMKILAEAAPEVYCEPRKPPQPDGTTPLDYTYKELMLLFEGASL